MSTFRYTAQNSKGDTVNGSIEALSRSAVLSVMQAQDLRPISIQEVKPTSIKVFNFKKKTVKSDHLVLFTRELSAMIGAGVPLLRSLSSLHINTTDPILKQTIGDVIKDIQAGSTFADALDRHKQVFSDVYINMVRAGEAAGILDDILKRLAAQQEKNASMRKKIKSAMTYPMVLVIITVLAFFGLMLFVIPQIGKIVKDLGGPDAELPPLTLLMLSISDFIVGFWFIVIPLLIGAAYALLRYIKTPPGRRLFHTVVLKIPGIKTIIIKVAIARFARTFSALMGAGVAVVEALRVTSHAIGNVMYEDALLAAIDEVKNGKTLSSVIQNDPLFPPIVSQMLAVGEETGQTDTVLVKVADFYEEEVDVAIDGISAIIEPVMIVVMGAMVGLIAASVMQPIAGLSQNIKG